MQKKDLECGHQLAVEDRTRAVWCPVCNDMTLVVRDTGDAPVELVAR